MAKFFVNRPIVAIVISIIFVIVGIVAMLGLPIAQYPDIVPPEIKKSFERSLNILHPVLQGKAGAAADDVDPVINARRGRGSRVEGRES